MGLKNKKGCTVKDVRARFFEVFYCSQEMQEKKKEKRKIGLIDFVLEIKLVKKLP